MRGCTYGAILALALACSVADAAPPKVSAPVKIRPGEITSVEIEVEAGKEVAWAPGFAAEAVFVDEGKPLRKDTARLIVSPRQAGVYRVILWTVGEREYSTLVIDAGTKPPDPIVPDLSELAKASKDAADKSSPAAGERAALARAQRSIASAINAGGITKPVDILKAWRDANNAAVTAANWKVWAEAMSAALAKLYGDGKLPNPKAWADAFTEIANGLEG